MASGAQIGSIYYDLDLDSSKFDSGLSKAKKGVASFKDASKIGADAFDGLVGTFKTGAKYILGAATAIGGLATVAIKSASDMQMLRTNLDVVAGSTEAGAKVFKELYDFAAKTPFETTELAKATQTMLSFGISNEKVMPYLKMLGDVSLGNKEKLQGLSLAFAQVQSTGKLMGQDLLQMINQGFNPLTIIAQKTGKSMGQLKEEMADGAITAEMVADAFKTATSEGGLFYKGMEKGSKTLSGTISTLTDNIWMTARGVVGLSDTGEVIENGLFDKVGDAVNKMTKYLEDNRVAITQWGQQLVNAGVKWVTDVALPWTKEHLPAIKREVINTGQAIWNMTSFIYEHRTAVLILIGVLGTLKVTYMALETWQKATTLFTGLKAGFETVAGAASGLAAFLTNPWVLAITAAAAAIGGIIWYFNRKKESIDLNKVALQELEQAEKNYASLQTASAQAEEMVILKKNAVKDAQNKYNDAVKQFGPDSDQAKDALASLKAREFELRDASEEAKNKVNDLNTELQKIEDSKKKAESPVKWWNDKMHELAGNGNGAARAIANFNDIALGKKTSLDVPQFASGVQNFRGGLAVVGERGPELVSLPRGADVIPNNKMASGGGISVNINPGFLIGSPSEARELGRIAYDEIKRLETAGAI